MPACETDTCTDYKYLDFADFTELPNEINIDKIKLSITPLVERVKGFSKLEYNWDSYGANKISWETISKAIDFIGRVIADSPDSPLPFIAPVPDGSIHFEWEKCTKELRHLIPREKSDSYIYNFIDRSTGELKQSTNAVNGIDRMFQVFSDWMNS